MSENSQVNSSNQVQSEVYGYYTVIPFCVAIIKDETGKILMGRHPQSPKKPYPGYWDFPGGKMEMGETPEECVKREIKEELNFDITKLELIGTYHHSGKYMRTENRACIPGICICYEAEVTGEMISTEQEDVHFASSDEIKTLRLTPWAEHFLNYDN